MVYDQEIPSNAANVLNRTTACYAFRPQRATLENDGMSLMV